MSHDKESISSRLIYQKVENISVSIYPAICVYYGENCRASVLFRGNKSLDFEILTLISTQVDGKFFFVNAVSDDGAYL